MIENKKPTVFYFGLEPLKARYTYQLSTKWMPEAFELQSDKVNFVDIPGEFDETQEIKVGAVLDAVGRGKYAMSQCANFLSLLNEGNVKDGDIIFLQDFWTPGIESIFYALDLYESDFENFIYYNAVDCALVHYIDKKLKTQQTFFKIAMTGGVEINRCLSPVWSTEVMMLRYFTKRKQVFVSERSEETHLKFAGGYVMDPIVGLHEWVACYDFASLYPNAIVQWGISPETYKGKDRVNPDPNWIKTASGAYFGGDDEESILRTIVKDLYAKRRATKDKMLDLQIKIDGLEKELKKLEKEQ